MSRDDALEWFGGTADGKYLVMSNAADDSLDWTFGWTGRIQFVAVTQRGDDADNGIEADDSELNNNVLPRSTRRSTTSPYAETRTGTKAARARVVRTSAVARRSRFETSC